MRDLHLHVPTPGELISPTSGSAIVTVARALGAAQISSGGHAAFLARAGMDHQPRPLGLISAQLPNKVWLTAPEKVGDLIAGALTGRSPFTGKMWGPIYDAIPASHDGPVFLHSAPGAAAGLRRVRPLSQRVVYLHNEVTRGWSSHARRRLVANHRVVCVSRFIADRFVPGAAKRGELLALINGVDTDTFRPAANQQEPTVLFVGKVVPHKGPDLLIEAARLLHAEGLRFRLRIVGGAVLSASAQRVRSEFEQRLHARAETLGDCVEFLPFVDRDHIAEIYATATIMVVPSNWDEPCSLTLPEGMAAGLACIASRRGGLPEVGADAPLYFDPPDVAELAACLRLLLTDDGERLARATAARARAEEITWARQLAILNDWLANGRTES